MYEATVPLLIAVAPVVVKVIVPTAKSGVINPEATTWVFVVMSGTDAILGEQEVSE